GQCSCMKIILNILDLRTLAAYTLALLILATFVSYACSAPQGSFQRRNWTPQAMLYLKGTQGRRFVSEDRNEGDVFDTLQLETRSQNTEDLSMSKAATVLLQFLQQVKDEGICAQGSNTNRRCG
uniref:Spexin hormone n=1 Tax=Electrophorus electricus TaxID=8005 RepID=A0A4W4FAK9_ELEEL